MSFKNSVAISLIMFVLSVKEELPVFQIIVKSSFLRMCVELLSKNSPRPNPNVFYLTCKLDL